MKIKHVTINTADLEKSIKFYTDVIGLKIQGDMRPNKPIVFLAYDETSACIELISDAKQAYTGSGISIGFQVDDVDEAYKDYKSRGLAPSPIIKPSPNTKFFFIKDPNGVNIQII